MPAAACPRRTRIAASAQEARSHADAPRCPAGEPAGATSPRWLVPTGIAELDARLQGGIPRGHLSEFVGPRSSGRLAVVVSALAGATARGEAVALIDPLDMFDPVSAAASGIDFARMLWVRGEATSAARVSLSCEYGTLQKSLDRGGQGAQPDSAGRRVRPGRARSGRNRASRLQAAAVHHLAAAASRHRRQRHGVCADGVGADRAKRGRSHGAWLWARLGPRLEPKPGALEAWCRRRAGRSSASDGDRSHVCVPVSAAAC